jgi:hypothetical protein
MPVCLAAVKIVAKATDSGDPIFDHESKRSEGLTSELTGDDAYSVIELVLWSLASSPAALAPRVALSSL